MTSATIRPDASLASLALEHAGASRVFHRHGLDFCCQGRTTLADACASSGLDVNVLAAELVAEARDTDEVAVRWDERPLDELIDHLLATYHEPHRAELPRLREMAEKVERVHADKPNRPEGLAAFLEEMHESLELHMQKEEQMLFPMIRSGAGRRAAMPVQVMEQEHLDHADNLQRLRKLAHQFVPPPEACTTWKALYLGLSDLERMLMEHIGLENNVLFPRSLRG